MVVSKEPIENSVDDKSFWVGISDSHDTIQYMLCELVDDSLSSIISNPVKQEKVIITITEKLQKQGTSEYWISVEDSGAGIKNPSACFSFANTMAGESPLNRYGVALKKVLATFDPSNRKWVLETRSENEAKEGRYRRIEAPYSSNNMATQIIAGEEWKGVIKGSGTLICFPCSEALLATSGKEYPGHAQTLEEWAECIREELSVVYAPHIKEKRRIQVNVVYADGRTDTRELEMIEPNWINTSKMVEGEEIRDFGGGNCRVRYRFGQIENHPATKRYFQKNFANSGLMVYENGRLIESHIFKEIWNKVHPTYNAFLGIVEIDPIDGAEALPLPTPTKDALFYGDERVMNLYAWIKSICPSPRKLLTSDKPKTKSKKERRKIELTRREELVKKLREMYGESAVINTEVELYNCIEKTPPRLDIYLFAEGKVNLFECKAEDTSDKDVFQLMMYHMGALHDGINPDTITLVAGSHPKGVREIATYLNTCKDPNGNLYRYELKTWSDYGISTATH